MNSAPPLSEADRISELQSYAVLDTPPESAFDDLTKLAAYICGTPISLISLVDSNRIWFKSKVGLDVAEIPRIDGFCSSVIGMERILVVPDAAADARLASHPLVTSNPKLRFYAGAPLITPSGYRLGTLCVIDTVPREISAEQGDALESLARTVVTQLELRRSVENLKEARRTLLEQQTRTEAQVNQRTEQLALTNSSLQRLSGQLIRAQDDERRRIARELHDSTGQVLAALSMTLGQMEKDSSDANRRKFEECREMIGSATAEIRNLSYLLHPPMMDEVGLASALAEYARGFEKRSGLSIQVQISQDVGRLEAMRELALFRVVQESLGNIHRHSGSSTAMVRVFCLDKDIVLEIRDQGRGLSGDSGKPVSFGVGINSMQERLRQLGGSLQIESDTTGTIVRAVLSREAPENQASAR
jgi:signal transduction histidine kinase